MEHIAHIAIILSSWSIAICAITLFGASLYDEALIREGAMGAKVGRLFVFAALAAGVAIYLQIRPPSTQAGAPPQSTAVQASASNAVWAACSDPKEPIKGLLQSWQTAGVIKRVSRIDESSGKIEVDEFRWERTTYDAKVSMAIAAYCQYAAPGGYGTVLVRGIHDGQLKGSIVNGQYSS